MKLFRKKNSPYFWYDFTIRGQRYRGSTKERNEKRAAKVAALIFSEACNHSDPLPRKAPALKALANRFLEWVDRGRLADKSKTYYRNGWRLLSATHIVNMRLDAISNDDAEALRFPGSAANANCALRTLRRILHKAEDWKMIRRAPKIKVPDEIGRLLMLDANRERQLLAGAGRCKWRDTTRNRFRAVVVLMRDTGMRNERELFQVRIEHIDWEKCLIYVPDSKTAAGVRNVILSDRALEVARELCGQRREGWLFPSKRSASGHLTTVANLFRQARREAGLPEELVLYCARHDFATRVMEHTKNPKQLMQLMGQKDPKTAMKYQHPDYELVRAALNASNATG